LRTKSSKPVDEREELSMSTTGLSKSRLELMHQVLAGYVGRKEMPGLVALVSHHDDVHVEAVGTKVSETRGCVPGRSYLRRLGLRRTSSPTPIPQRRSGGVRMSLKPSPLKRG
jgi:hypothetical protein